MVLGWTDGATSKESPCGSEKPSKPMVRIPSAEQISQTEGTYFPTRVERLLAERQMRRNSSAIRSSSSIGTLGSTDELSNRDSYDDLIQLSMDMTDKVQSDQNLRDQVSKGNA